MLKPLIIFVSGNLFALVIILAIVLIPLFTSPFGYGEFDFDLGNDFWLVANNSSDIHISDKSGVNNTVNISPNAGLGFGRRPGIVNIPDDEYETSLLVPPRIRLLGKTNGIVYGFNMSIRQHATPSVGLSAKYFGWFVLDTLECKCWVGLTEEEMLEILENYQISNPAYQFKRTFWGSYPRVPLANDCL